MRARFVSCEMRSSELELSCGGSSLSSGAAKVDVKKVMDRSRRKVRKGDEQFSGDVLIKLRMEDWMEDEAERKEQLQYRDLLMKNMLPSWCDLDDNVAKETKIQMGFEDIVEPSKGIAVDLSNPL